VGSSIPPTGIIDPGYKSPIPATGNRSRLQPFSPTTMYADFAEEADYAD
jgi:hypothetical protein